MIAFVKQDNQIESDIISQLEQLMGM